VDKPPVLIALAAVGLLAGAWLIFMLFVYLRARRRLALARAALDAGDTDRARSLVAPLLARFPTISFVDNAAAEILYETGDPLSAASLWERAMKRLGPREVAPRLVAAYAALNRAGDARRVAALAPDDGMVRLALVWSELVAVGGDRVRALELVDALARDASLRVSASSDAMVSALEAIAAARRGDAVSMRAALARAERRKDELAAHDRAFIGYLGGIALREAESIDDARATFTMAMDAAPDSIGAALARRECSHLPQA